MRRFFYIIVLIGVGFALGFGYREIGAEIQEKQKARKNRMTYATAPILENKSFVVITLAEDNEKDCEHHLLSVLNQEYESFRVIYIDYSKSNQSFQKAKTFLSNHDLNGRVTLVRNGAAIESLYRAIHSCKSDEVVVLLRGDEFFAHSEVLKKLNHYFADHDVWMTAAEEVLIPTYSKGTTSPFYQAFYAGLFNRIKLQDFLKEGQFLQEGYEEMVTLAMKDLAGRHACHIPETLFLSQKEREFSLEERRDPYPRLKENPWHDFVSDEERVDLVIFSYNRPLQLYAFLESSKKYIDHLHRQYVIYRAGNDHYEKGYQKVKEDFPNVLYIRQSSDSPYEDFAPTVRNTVFDQSRWSTRYVAFALDDSVVKDFIDMKEAVRLLKNTGAYGFYFSLGDNLEDHPTQEKIPIQEGVFAWQFSSMEGEWKKPNSIAMTLYKKEDIYPDFLCMKFHNPQILQDLWSKQANLMRVGLYFYRSKVVDLPLNIVLESEWGDEKLTHLSTKELLTVFDHGLKMDTAPLDQLENTKVEIDFKPEFIKR